MPGPSPTGGPAIIWRYVLGGELTGATPAVGGGIVAVSDADSLVALDQATGQERWQVDLPASYSSPLITNGLIYIGTVGEGLKALDSITGREIWTFRTGAVAPPDGVPADVIESSPVLADGTLFIGGGFYGGLFALDPATGEEKWRFETHGETWSSPAVADGIVYVSTNGLWDADANDPAPSALYAVDAATGALVWDVPLSAAELSFSTPTVTNGVIVFGATNPETNTGTYLAIDVETGQERWRVATAAPLWGRSPGSNGTHVFLIEETAEGGNRLIALDPATGSTVWTYEAIGDRINGVINTGDTLYMHDNADDLTALDAATGEELWRFAIGGGGSPAVADGRIYVTGSRSVFAIGSADDPQAITLASPPGPPQTGPGSDDTRFPEARGTHYGPEPGGYWMWEPTIAADSAAPGPLPVLLYLSGCCGDEGWPTPEEVDPWLSHLARQGYVIIAPVYNPATPLEDSKARLTEALAELGKPGHVQVDLATFGVIGYSYGGIPSVTYAATAGDEGLPVPRAVFLVAPCTGIVFCPSVPVGLTFPEGMKAVVLGFADDELYGLTAPLETFGAFATLPREDRNFVAMSSDAHGQPPVFAHHETLVQDLNAADWYGIWKLSDALFACAFAGEWCEYALGDTPEQRFMGTWSDGVPVTELQVTHDSGAPESIASPESSPSVEATQAT